MTVSSNVRFDYQQRFGDLQSKLRTYEKNMKILNHVDLSICDFNKSPYAQIGGGRSINLPPWFLFKYEDIPSRFRINDISDPRLRDSRFLNEFAGWMNGKITEMGLSSICRQADHGILQHVIQLLRDPSLYEKGKDFIIGHELAHIAHSQEGLLAKVHEIMSLGGIMVGIFSLILAVTIAPVVHLGLTIGVSGVAIAITVGGVAGWLNQSKPVSLSEVEEEKQADLDSVEMLGDARGGIYYFQSSADRNLAIRRSNPLMQREIDERGNNLKDKDHPPLTDRVAYLRNWQAGHRIENVARLDRLYTQTISKIGLAANF